MDRSVIVFDSHVTRSQTNLARIVCKWGCISWMLVFIGLLWDGFVIGPNSCNVLLWWKCCLDQIPTTLCCDSKCCAMIASVVRIKFQQRFAVIARVVWIKFQQRFAIIVSVAWIKFQQRFARIVSVVWIKFLQSFAMMKMLFGSNSNNALL